MSEEEPPRYLVSDRDVQRMLEGKEWLQRLPKFAPWPMLMVENRERTELLPIQQSCAKSLGNTAGNSEGWWTSARGMT